MTKLFKRTIQMNGTQRTALDQARGRLVLLSAFFVIAYVIVVARAADVSLLQGQFQHGSEDTIVETSSVIEEKNIRADIVDRNGVILARSLKTASVYADPKMIENPEKVAKELAVIFSDLSYGAILQKLQSKKRFVWLKRNISPEQQSKILYMGVPGLNFETETRRIYPQGALAVHMVGTAGVDGQGLSGIERSFDGLLEKSSTPLKTTLDVRLQHVLKREISSTMKDFKAKAGSGLVMDVNTGEILAAVSLPDYDPHNYKKAKNNNKFNRVSLGVYELGSSFKIFSTAALLEKNKGNMAQRFDVREPLKVGRFKIRDYHPEKRIMSLPEVFIHSSNIGSAMMGQQVGTTELKNFYKDLGLMSAPDFEVPEIGKPLIPSPWGEVNTLTASYGHGIAVSPLQLTAAASSIMNGGLFVKPTLIANDNAHQSKTNESLVRVISPETSHRMRQLMRLTVTEGTGGNADVQGFLVGGKTGTAEKPGRGGYNRKKLISSFLGVFPMDAPQYVVYVMVDEPQGTKASYGYATGGWVGAPTVQRVISNMVSVLGLKPSEEKNKNFENSLMRHIKTKEQLKKEQKIEAH